MTVQTAIFAGGCFWCMVEPFETLPGIEKVRSGYTGGTVPNPTYDEVAAHVTGHTEAVKIWFDDDIISYQALVDLYWQLTDPTDAMGQFADRGDTYRPVIFVKDETQRQIATASKQVLDESGRFDKPIVTTIADAQPFYDAEEEHQQFYKKNPLREMLMMIPRKKYQQKYWSDKEATKHDKA